MRLTGTMLASVLLLSLTACQPADPTTEYQLQKLSDKLDAIDTKVNRLASAGPGAGAARAAPPAAAAPQPQQPQRAAADPNTVYSVAIGDAPTKGPSNAKVTIVEAADFACPYCRQAEPTMEQIAAAYPNDVRLVFKHFVVHPQVATIPAYAACAAQKQGKFWEMKTAIWDAAWGPMAKPARDMSKLSEDNMVTLAQGLQLNMDKFKTDMKSSDCKDQIEANQKLSQVGVDGTPSFFVNGRIVSGALPFERFKAIIDEELQKANDAIKGGVKPEEFYQKNVVEKGKKSLG